MRLFGAAGRSSDATQVRNAYGFDVGATIKTPAAQEAAPESAKPTATKPGRTMNRIGVAFASSFESKQVAKPAAQATPQDKGRESTFWRGVAATARFYREHGKALHGVKGGIFLAGAATAPAAVVPALVIAGGLELLLAFMHKSRA